MCACTFAVEGRKEAQRAWGKGVEKEAGVDQAKILMQTFWGELERKVLMMSWGERSVCVRVPPVAKASAARERRRSEHN